MSPKPRAAVFTGPNRPFEWRDGDQPSLADGEALVRVLMCTLCGSDLHTYEGRRATACPTVLGHEILGRVEALPEVGAPTDATGGPLRIGERVTWSIAASCSNCFYCARDLPQKCQRLFKYGHEQLTKRRPLSGGLATHCHLVQGTAIFVVPDELPHEVACPANCATATVVAALRRAGDCRDQAVLVQGAGMLGLTAAAMAHDRGAREVIVCDLDPQRLERATQFGATHTVLADRVEQVVRDTTDGHGADIALELSGSPDAIEAGTKMLRIGGCYIWVGAVFPSRPVELSAEHVVKNLLRIEGLHNYAPGDLAEALGFLRHCHGRYPFEQLVERHFSLEKTDEAFRYAINNRCCRVAVQSESA